MKVSFFPLIFLLHSTLLSRRKINTWSEGKEVVERRNCSNVSKKIVDPSRVSRSEEMRDDRKPKDEQTCQYTAKANDNNLSNFFLYWRFLSQSQTSMKIDSLKTWMISFFLVGSGKKTKYRKEQKGQEMEKLRYVILIEKRMERGTISNQTEQPEMFNLQMWCSSKWY